MASLTDEAAGSSSSSSLSISSTDHQTNYTYDVFLSFRGKDTRFNFTDHLYNTLRRRGIKTFRDDKLPRGEDISQELLKAIDKSRVSIIVFSQNYAASWWCLDELVKILACRKPKGQEVRAVFYKVDPSDVRHQTGAFGDAFATLDQCKYKDSMGKWKAALKEAADLSGWPFKDGEYESNFIDGIVEELSTQVINPSYDLHVAEHPIGLDSCRQDVIRLLNATENNMVGIWGPGGIGKTTIAKHVYNSIRHHFEVSCFLTDFRSKDEAELQRTLLSCILRDPNLQVSSVHHGFPFINTRMQEKKVLLVLDDVSDYSQVQILAPSSKCFGPGSRILITTKDKGWLTAQVGVYEVKLLNDVQALELFSLHALEKKGPPHDYLELARRAVHYAGGLPLALTRLGSHLCGRSREKWETTLDGCKGEDPHIKIRNDLKISYDALKENSDLRGCFLDVACFFKGEYVDNVEPILRACYKKDDIPRLVEKALIRIDNETLKGARIWMHNLIEEMGKRIVSQEGEPDEGSRLWKYNEIDDVLTDNTGTEKIKGIQVQCEPWEPGNQGYYEICLNAKSFSEMKQLRYFSSSSLVEYSGNIDYLPKQLRWLNWPGCPIKSFPSNFNPKNLVALNIPKSPHITRLWKGVQNFPFLTHMDLSGCKSLTELPDFTRIRNLEELNLDGCERLGEVHQSVGSLHKLVTFNLKGCSNLVTLPTEISLKSLLALDLSDCTRLEKFPNITRKMDSLKKLILSCTGIKELHQSIGNLIGLNQLYLVDCKNLTTLPCSTYELQNLGILDVSGCSKLARFPTKASISHDDDSGSLALPKLRVLRIKGCNLSTADFVGSLDCLDTLTELDLSSNNFVTVPALGKFVNLTKIDLYCCKRLREIPELPPNILKVNAGDCALLERFLIFPKSLKMLEMNLWNCHKFSDNLGNDMEKMKNILLNNQSKSRFTLVLPGSEVPKWFCRSKEVPANETGPDNTCAIFFEIPSELNWENIGLALCTAEEPSRFMIAARTCIFINGLLIDESDFRSSTPDHMRLTYIPLSGEIKGKVDQKGGSRYEGRVEFFSQTKSCGVHLVRQPPNEYSNKIVMAAEPADGSDMPMRANALQQQRRRNRANEDYDHEQEQQEQPIPSKRHCTEEQPSMPPIPDYSASSSAPASTSDQSLRTSNWQANLDLLPNSLPTPANLDPTSPASTP